MYHLGHPKVTDLGATKLIDEDVARLQVAVQELRLGGMDVAESHGHVVRDADGRGVREPPRDAVQDLLEATARCPLEDKHDARIGTNARAHEHHDIGVPKRAQDGDLPQDGLVLNRRGFESALHVAVGLLLLADVREHEFLDGSCGAPELPLPHLRLRAFALLAEDLQLIGAHQPLLPLAALDELHGMLRHSPFRRRVRIRRLRHGWGWGWLLPGARQSGVV
mmetsp:Transcript_29981/g.95807  ORF Transcript_29981/g.95807 Transcript_29981/m.95807 type:complete len:222 (-) Transcript_29981:603-1268(-)